MNTSVLLSFVSNKKTATSAALAILKNMIEENAVAGDGAEDVKVVVDLLSKYNESTEPKERKKRRTKAEMAEARGQK